MKNKVYYSGGLACLPHDQQITSITKNNLGLFYNSGIFGKNEVSQNLLFLTQ